MKCTALKGVRAGNRRSGDGVTGLACIIYCGGD